MRGLCPYRESLLDQQLYLHCLVTQLGGKQWLQGTFLCPKVVLVMVQWAWAQGWQTRLGT